MAYQRERSDMSYSWWYKVYKVNSKYETSKLELSWINLGIRTHSHYHFYIQDQTAGINAVPCQ